MGVTQLPQIPQRPQRAGDRRRLRAAQRAARRAAQHPRPQTAAPDINNVPAAIAACNSLKEVARLEHLLQRAQRKAMRGALLAKYPERVREELAKTAWRVTVCSVCGVIRHRDVRACINMHIADLYAHRCLTEPELMKLTRFEPGDRPRYMSAFRFGAATAADAKK